MRSLRTPWAFAVIPDKVRSNDVRQFVALAVLPAQVFIGLGVVEGFRGRVELELLAGPPGDVAGVAHGAADVPLADLLVEGFAPAALDRVEEVADVEVVGQEIAPFLDELALAVERLPAPVAEQHPAVLAVDGRALVQVVELRLRPD